MYPLSLMSGCNNRCAAHMFVSVLNCHVCVVVMASTINNAGWLLLGATTTTGKKDRLSIETTYMNMYTDGDHVDTYHDRFNLHLL